MTVTQIAMLEMIGKKLKRINDTGNNGDENKNILKHMGEDLQELFILFDVDPSIFKGNKGYEYPDDEETIEFFLKWLDDYSNRDKNITNLKYGIFELIDDKFLEHYSTGLCRVVDLTTLPEDEKEQQKKQIQNRCFKLCSKELIEVRKDLKYFFQNMEELYGVNIKYEKTSAIKNIELFQHKSGFGYEDASAVINQEDLIEFLQYALDEYIAVFERHRAIYNSMAYLRREYEQQLISEDFIEYYWELHGLKSNKENRCKPVPKEFKDRRKDYDIEELIKMLAAKEDDINVDEKSIENSQLKKVFNRINKTPTIHDGAIIKISSKELLEIVLRNKNMMIAPLK